MEKNKTNNGFKKFRKILFRTILVLLLLLLLVSIGLTLPVVQTRIAKYATEELNKSYGTDIQIDEVAITVFGSVKLKKVYVKDHHKDTLIYANRLKTNIIGFKNLLNNKMIFGDISADSLFLNIKQYKGEKDTSLDKFIATFDDGKPSSGKFLLTSDNVYLRNSRFAMTDYNRENPKDVDFKNLNAKLKDLKIKGPNVYATIAKMSFNDHRGLIVKNLTSDFTYTKKNIKLEKLAVKTENSFIKGKTILSYERKDFSNFNNKVLFDVELDSADIATNDIRYFYKEIGKDKTFFVKSKIKGTLNDFYTSNLYLQDDKGSVIKGDVNFKNLFPRSPGEFYMKGDFDKIASNYDNLTKILPNILGKKLPTSLKKLGQFQFVGDVEVTQKYLNSNFVMNTALGIVESDLQMSNIDNIDNAKYSGNIILDNFDVGTMLNDKSIGRVSMNIDVDGKGFTQKLINTTFVGDINKVTYKGYTYRKVIVDGYFKQPIFKGKVFINDPNLFMDFDGFVDLSKKDKVVDFHSKIDYANLEKLNIINDSISVFKGEIGIKAKGSTLDNFVGDVLLTNASYQNKKDIYFVDYLNVNSSFDAYGERTVEIKSPDAIEGNIIGKFQFDQLQKMVENSLGSLYTNYKPNPVKKGQYLKFDFALYSKIIEIFYPDISLAANTNLKGKISSDSQDFKLDFSSPQILAYENTFDNVLLQVDNRNPLYKSYVQLDSIKTKHYKIRDFSLINTIVNDSLYFRTEFKGGNEGKDFYNLNLYHTINKENKNVIGFKKSELMFKDYLWYLNEKEEDNSKIIFDKKLQNFNFDNIVISHENERLNLIGNINGKNYKDLKLSFANVNLNKITPEVEKFKFDGFLDGDIFFKQNNTVYQPTSSLSIKDLKVNDIPLGKLNLDIQGDESLSKFYIDSNLENKEVRAFNAKGSITVQEKETFLDVDLNFEKFNLGVLGKIGGDVITNIRGFASGNARIDGNIKELDYNGRLYVNESGFTIPYLNADYRFEDNTVVDVTEEKFIVRETNITDSKFGTKGNLSGFIKHNQFGNWKLDLNIDAERLLALNTKDHEDAAYFGTAFMKGTASITGPTDGLLIKVKASSAKGTDIKIPINDAEAVSENKFIQIVSKGNINTNTNSVTTRNYNGLELDFEFDITDNATIEVILNRDSGHGMRGKGFGTLLFKINTLGKFEMWGDFLAYEGTYNFKYGGLIDKKFDVRKGGSINWNGDPMAATLNLEAVYRTSANPGILNDNSSLNRKVDVDVVIGVKGSLTNPEPDFTIEFPKISSVLRSEIQYKLDDKDVRQTQALYLLSTGSFISLNGGFGQNAITNSLFETAGSMFGDILNDKDGKISLTPEIVTADRTPGQESNGRVGVTLSSKITDRITINGKVGVPVGGISETAVVGDVEVQYRVNDDGTLNLRVFNRENDINYLGQGIGYTQGLGISYEVDFDDLAELINKIFKKNKIQVIKTPKATDTNDSDFSIEGIKIDKDKKDKKDKGTQDNQNNKDAIPHDD